MSQEKLLIVDDEQVTRNVYRTLLETAGFQVVEAAGYDQAIDLMDSSIDIALLDVVLKKKSGLDILKHIRRHFPTCPVIMISGHANKANTIAALHEGAAEYLEKSVSSHRLVHIMKHWASYHAMQHDNSRLQDYKATVEALREREAHFSGVLDITRDAIISVSQDQCIQIFNKGAERIFGYKTDEVLGKSLDILLPEVSTRIHQKHFREFMAGEDTLQPMYGWREVHARRKDGTVFTAEATISKLTTENGITFTAMLHDLTARKKNENALRYSEEKFRNIIDASPIPYALNDEKQNITYLNPVFINTFGYELQDIPTLGHWWPKAYPDTKYRQWVTTTWQQHLDKAKREGTPFETIELDIRCKDGTTRTTIVGATQLSDAFSDMHLVTLYDITERKQAEANIKRLSDLYAALSQCSQAIVHSSSEKELFPKVCRAAVEFGHMKMAWVGLVDEASQMVEPLAAFGTGIEYLDGIQISTSADVPFGRGPVGSVMRNNMPFWCQDYMNDSRLAPWHERGALYNWGSMAALPLHRKGKIIGSLNLYADEINAFDAAARKLLQEMVAEIDYALDRFALEAERMQVEKELHITATVFESQESLIITDADKVILRVNQAFTESTGYTAEEIVGQTPSILKSGRHDAAFYAAMWESIQQTGAWHGEIWDRRKNGAIYPKWLSITAVKGSDGKVTHYVGSHIDITERKAAEKEIRSLALYDPLTKLPNRRFLLDRLRQAIAASRRTGREGSLLFIDLDNFKMLNDTRGHNTGDLLLQQVGQRLISCVRENDTVARLSGDEFVILLENLSDQSKEAAAQTEIVSEKILATLSKPYHLAGHDCISTPSIGGTLFNFGKLEMDDLFKQADIAMYQAKKAGRNTMRFFDPEMQKEINTRAALESELRNALEKKQFRLYYQIQVDKENRPLGAEALIRWIHPDRGEISPMQFIPLAEATSLILPIGQWVLETACAQIKAWEKHPLACKLTLAVNVSAKRFQQDDFVSQTLETVQRYAINPMQLKLELTESMLHENIEETIAKMNVLNEIGIKFSLDDFGTGYSSLQYLKKLPLDQLKIDQSFVRDIADDSNDKAIVATIIAMAHNLGMGVIAEGVETEEQRQFLIENDCTNFQGHLYGKPVSIEQFEAQLAQN